MKKLSKITILLFTCLLLLTNISFASDTTAISEDNAVETNKETEAINIINTDLYLSGEDVVIDQPTNGNVFIAATNVTIKSEVNGDVFVIAENLVIEKTGLVYNNIFALANNMTMSGIAYDVYAFADVFTLEESGYLYRDLKLFAETSTTLNGKIARDAYIASNGISVLENAENIIGGNLHYTSSQVLVDIEKAVAGEVKFTPVTEEVAPTTSEIISNYIYEFISVILLMVVVILFATFLAPNFIEKSAYFATKRKLSTAGIGILAFVLLPLVAIILMITGVLVYVSLALLAVYTLVLCITLAILSLAVAKVISEKLKIQTKGKFILLSLASATIIFILQRLPYIGGYISLFTLVFGFGLFIVSLFGKKKVEEVKE